MGKFCVKGEKTWPLFRQLYLTANILFNSNTEYRKQNTKTNTKKIQILCERGEDLAPLSTIVSHSKYSIQFKYRIQKTKHTKKYKTNKNTKYKNKYKYKHKYKKDTNFV